MTRLTSTSPQRPSVAVGAYQAHPEADVAVRQGTAARDFYTWTQTVTIAPAP